MAGEGVSGGFSAELTKPSGSRQTKQKKRVAGEPPTLLTRPPGAEQGA